MYGWRHHHKGRSLRNRIFMLVCFAAIFVFVAGCNAQQPTEIIEIKIETPKIEATPLISPAPSPSIGPVDNVPKPTSTIEPTQTPTLTIEPTQTPRPRLFGMAIGIDPGHQGHANSDQEPVSPSSPITKKKVSSGTQGRWTGVAEYQVNLNVGLLLRDLLEKEGATVIMTRTSNDVDISNAERAILFNESKTDYAIRLHCNGSDDAQKHGAFMLIPSDNPYADKCRTAAEILIQEYCEATGIKNLGISVRSDQTGFNWCNRMIINIEMGHMTNKDEDYYLTSEENQAVMAQGIANGIIQYLAKQGEREN